MGAGLALWWLRRRDADRGGKPVVFRGGDTVMKVWGALTDEARAAVCVVVLVVEAWLLWG